MPMKNPPHPGLSVRYDCLEPLNISVTEAAQQLGVSRKKLSGIVNCRAETWYRLQATYEMAQALKRTDQLKVKRLSPDG